MKYINIFLVTILGIITPISGLLLLMFSFVILDLISGVYVTIKLNGLSSFKSNKFFNTPIKLFFYLGTIIMAFMIDKYLISETLFSIQFLITKTITIVWCYNEMKSIDENSMKLGNRSIWIIIKEILNKIKNVKNDINKT